MISTNLPTRRDDENWSLIKTFEVQEIQTAQIEVNLRWGASHTLHKEAYEDLCTNQAALLLPYQISNSSSCFSLCMFMIPSSILETVNSDASHQITRQQTKGTHQLHQVQIMVLGTPET